MAKEPPNLLEFARTANAGAPKLRSAVPTQRPAPPTASAAVVIPAAPAVPRDSAAVVLALAPPAPSYAEPAPAQFAARHAQPTSPVGAIVLATAGVMGLVLSLYRNDVFYGLTHASRWDNQYLGLEHALGSPAFGTPRSLDSLVHVAPAATGPAVPSLPADTATQAAEAKPAAAVAPTEAAAPAVPAARAAAAEADADPAPAPKGRAKSVAIASKVARPAAKHAAPESDDAPAPKKAAAPEPDEELPTKKASPFGLPSKSDAKKADAKKAPEPKDTAPTLDLNDAIKASMEKKGH